MASTSSTRLYVATTMQNNLISQKKHKQIHGVNRMISVDNFFLFLSLLFFALSLLYVTKCTLWRLSMAFLKY